MKVLLAHPGTQYSFHLAGQLYKHGLLSSFYTGIAFGEGSWQKKTIGWMPHSYQNKISNRILKGIPHKLIKNNFFLELITIWKLKNGKKSEEIFYKRNKIFQENIPNSAIEAVDIVIGFDTSSWILAKRCKELGKRFVLDVSIAHPNEKQNIYDYIKRRYPCWAFSLKEKSQYLIDLEVKEMELADAIIIASSFSKETLIKQGVEERKISVNPYGTDITYFKPEMRENDNVIKFVFVGLVDARKGIPVLLDAWKQMDKERARLTIIGPVSEEARILIKNQFSEIVITGKIPYKDLPAALSKHDVLVFPSFFEGFGLVIPEAMASGLIVITTPATCGPDILKDEESGFIVPPGDVFALAKKMQLICNSGQSLLQDMKKNALETVKNFSWDDYGKRWRAIINNCN